MRPDPSGHSFDGCPMSDSMPFGARIISRHPELVEGRNGALGFVVSFSLNRKERKDQDWTSYRPPFILSSKQVKPLRFCALFRELFAVWVPDAKP